MEKAVQLKFAKLVITSTLEEDRCRISDAPDKFEWEREINKIKVNTNKCKGFPKKEGHMTPEQNGE